MKKVTLYYFTDPICSYCWALEKQLNKFLFKYEKYIDIHYIFGGLLESWEQFEDQANGISRAEDVRNHWREVQEKYAMPMDGSLWLHDPILSSYPASQMLNAVEHLYPERKKYVLRAVREAVFVFDRNIGKREILEEILAEQKMDVQQVMDYAFKDSGHDLLEEDFKAMEQFHVRSFPTLIFTNGHKTITLEGVVEEERMAMVLQEVSGEALVPDKIPSLPVALQEKERLYYPEIEILYNISKKEIPDFIKLHAPDAVVKEFYNGEYIERA